MALISTKGAYGLAAMFELAQMETGKPIQIKEIVNRTGLSQNYLEQLLTSLRKANLVKTIRGAYGGYMLARDSKNITVKEVLIALEGTISVVDLEIKNQALNLFYQESNKKLEKIFDLPLSDLDEYQQQVSQQICYTI